MKQLRVFFDANILFSASLGRGTVFTLTETVRELHEAVTAQLAVDEARRNLEHKLPKSAHGLTITLAHIQILPELDFPHGLDLPNNDGRLLGTAIAHHCTHFLTGDKRHFGSFYGTKVAHITIVSPTMLAASPDLL